MDDVLPVLGLPRPRLPQPRHVLEQRGGHLGQLRGEVVPLLGVLGEVEEERGLGVCVVVEQPEVEDHHSEVVTRTLAEHPVHQTGEQLS